MGRVKISFFQSPKYASTMSTSQNINVRTVAPTIVNPELVLVDSNPEEDPEEIQHEAAAKQARIEEVMRAKIAAAHKHIERKGREWKAEEAQKAEEAWKVEEDRVAKEKASEESQKHNLK